jgi:predicted metal-dependent phosphoesterase TrpH
MNNSRRTDQRSDRIALAGTASLSMKAKMTRKQANKIEMRGMADLHMHSTYSDGVHPIEQMLAYAQEQSKLDVIAITDHNEIEGSLRARDLWAQGNYRFDFVVGEEVSTREGHLLGLFIEKLVPAGLSIERSIDLIHEQGGLAVIAHPLHPWFPDISCQKAVLDRIAAAKDVWLDGIETWNASFCGIYANGAAMQANRTRYGLAELGGSDAHTKISIGRGFTWFMGRSANELRTAIEQGQSAPGGKFWSVRACYHWARHKAQKPESLAMREPNGHREPGENAQTQEVLAKVGSINNSSLEHEYIGE